MHGTQGGASARRLSALALLSLLFCWGIARDAKAIVPSTTNIAQYTVVTGSDSLSVPYYFLSASDLAVVSALHGVLVQGTGYTVTLPATDGAGGFVTLIGQTPTDIITITRTLALTQPMQLRGQGPLSPPILENSADRAVMQIQQLEAQILALQAIVNTLSPDGGTVGRALFFQSASGTGGVQMWDATQNAWVYLYSKNGVLKNDTVQPP